jgi:hypothetical protein
MWAWVITTWRTSSIDTLAEPGPHFLEALAEP